MNLHDVLLPVFVQVALTFVLLFVMAGRRFGAIRGGAVRADDVSFGQRAWPGAAQRASNAFSNQFELPVLYFALVPLALLTRKADVIFVVLSWVFVISRIVHAAIYVASTNVQYRFLAFLVGAVALIALWVQFAIRILTLPLPA